LDAKVSKKYVSNQIINRKIALVDKYADNVL